MKCDCDNYEHLKLHRKAITKRIKKAKSLKKMLELLAENEEQNNSLYECSNCKQLWQSSIAWNWHAKEYLYKVPETEIEDWLSEQFVQPDN